MSNKPPQVTESATSSETESRRSSWTIETLREAYELRIERLIGSRIRPPLVIDDLAQEVWIKVANSIGKLDDREPWPWLAQIAKNTLIDAHRKLSRQVRGDSEGLDQIAADDSCESEAISALRECLEQLGGSLVGVLKAVLIDGRNRELLAHELDISLATVNTRIHRGKELLRDCISRKTT